MTLIVPNNGGYIPTGETERGGREEWRGRERGGEREQRIKIKQCSRTNTIDEDIITRLIKSQEPTWS